MSSPEPVRAPERARPTTFPRRNRTPSDLRGARNRRVGLAGPLTTHPITATLITRVQSARIRWTSLPSDEVYSQRPQGAGDKTRPLVGSKPEQLNAGAGLLLWRLREEMRMLSPMPSSSSEPMRRRASSPSGSAPPR
jgi:hypothetical protein